MKYPRLGLSDFGYIENGTSPITIQRWMEEVTARINRLEADVHGRHIPKSDLTITAKQAEVYQFVANKIDSGEKVRLKDVCERFGYKSESSAQRMVDTLINKDMITRKGHTLEFVRDTKPPRRNSTSV